MKTSLLLLLALCLASSGAVAKGVKIQCWTDDQGHRSCGDAIPPKDAGKEREVMNEQGVMMQQKERAKTPAEQIEDEQAAARAKAQAAADAQKAERQHAYDRYLIESYGSVGDLEKKRDERLQALDTRIEIVQKAIDSGQAQLDALVARKASLQKGKFPVDKKLEDQIKEYRRAIVENPKALQALKTEKQKVVDDFARDIARYQELTKPAASENANTNTP